MRRLFVLIVALTALAVLTLPAAAMAAKTWTVKDTSGHARGTVRNTHGLFQGHVKYMDGRWAGWVSSSDSGSGILYGVFKGRPRTVIGGGLAVVWGAKLLRKMDQVNPTVIGRVVKKGSRWVVQKRANGAFHTLGAVPGACPRGYAMGAGRLLLW